MSTNRINLAPSHISAPRYTPVTNWNFPTSFSYGGYPGYQYYPPPIFYVAIENQGLTIIDVQLQNEFKEAAEEIEHYNHLNTYRLPELIREEINSLAGPSNPFPDIQDVSRRLSATDRLLSEKRAMLPIKHQRALSYYGTDPIGKNFETFAHTVPARDSHFQAISDWKDSYSAALEARRIEASIEHLSELSTRLTTERQRLETLAKEDEEKRQKEAQEASQAAERLRLKRKLVAEQTSARDEIFKARLQVSENAIELMRVEQGGALGFQKSLSNSVNWANQRPTVVDIFAEEQAHKLDLPIKRILSLIDTNTRASGKLATHQARRLTLLPDLRKLIENTAHGPVMPTTLRQARKLLNTTEKLIKDDEAFLRAYNQRFQELQRKGLQAVHDAYIEQERLFEIARAVPIVKPSTFSSTISALSSTQFLAASPRAVESFRLALPAISDALRGIIAEMALEAASKAALFASLMLYSTKLGNGDRFAIAVPLAHIDSNLDVTLKVGLPSGIPELDYRIGSRTNGDLSEIFVTKVDGEQLRKEIRIRRPKWDPKKRGYKFTTDGPAGHTIYWHPTRKPHIYSPDNPSIFVPPIKPYAGDIQIFPEGSKLSHPAIEDIEFDDYILVFPAKSGLPSIYLSVRGARYEVGVASGQGQTVSGLWLGPESLEKGAPIPANIAEQLRNRRFNSFDDFRGNFWRAIANDPILSKQFSESNLARMTKGGAPFSIPTERVGSRITFEIDHVMEIQYGGAVYDMDNLRVMTPKRHIAKTRSIR